MLQTPLEIFSLSQYHQGFNQISSIESNLTFTAAESLILKLNENSNYQQDHFIYSPHLDLTNAIEPSIGHAIEIVIGYYVKGIGIIDRSKCDDNSELQVTLSPFAYCNPRTIIDGKVTISTSDDLCPHLPVINMTRNGNIYQRF